MLWIIFKVFFSGNVRGRVEADMFCLFCFEESSKEKFSSNLSSSEHFSSRSFPGVTVLEKFLDLNVFYRSGRTFLSFWAEKHPGWTSKRLFWRCSLLQDNRWECFRWFLPDVCKKKKQKHDVSESWEQRTVRSAEVTNGTCDLTWPPSIHVILSTWVTSMWGAGLRVWSGEAAARQVFGLLAGFLSSLWGRSGEKVSELGHSCAAHGGTTAHFSAREDYLKAGGEKTSVLVKLPPLQVRWEEREVRAINH